MRNRHQLFVGGFVAVWILCAAVCVARPSALVVITDSAPADTIIVVESPSLMLGDEMLDDTLNVYIDKDEKVGIGITLPDDSLIHINICMDVRSLSPLAVDSMPDGICVDIFDPTILSDGVNRNKYIKSSRANVNLLYQ